jgi:alkyl sulfatase BDS1-like metallo-beta-lactamase superfamily hydrolase
MYQYLHDQTLRLANHGETMLEIAEQLELPPSLASEWYSRGYYGTVSHDVKAVYQRYFGFFDGNPANLHPHPPVEASVRYVDYMGGAPAVLERARADYDRGDYRWVAQVVNHVVFADPSNAAACALQADALEQLGYQAESGPWRNFYLMGALELRSGTCNKPELSLGAGMLRNMSIDMILDALAVRLNGDRAHDAAIVINLVDPGGDSYGVWVGNAVLHHRAGTRPDPDVTLTGAHDALAAVLFGIVPVDDAIAANQISLDGNRDKLTELVGLLDRFNPAFPIVTP